MTTLTSRLRCPRRTARMRHARAVSSALTALHRAVAIVLNSQQNVADAATSRKVSGHARRCSLGAEHCASALDGDSP